MSEQLTRRSALKRTAAVLGAPLLAGSVAGPAQAVQTIWPSPKRIHTDLCNFDLRVPWGFSANDLMIFVWGFFPNGDKDVVATYHNPYWGSPQVKVLPVPETEPGWEEWQWPWPLSPYHPGWGLHWLGIKYGPGAIMPGGSWMHFGIHFRPCRFHVHIEAWWTQNGIPIARAWLWHIHKIRVRQFWLVRLVNPRAWAPQFDDLPRHLYNPRYFYPAPDNLPRLKDLNTLIDPLRFGSSEGWQPLQVPIEMVSLELQSDSTHTLLVPNPTDSPTPPVVQMGLREERLTSPLPPEGMSDDPQTLAIVTDRAAQEFDADTNGDGIVATPDYNEVRRTYGKQSVDNLP